MPHFVSGQFEGLTLWAYLHAGRVAWTDHKPDAHRFTMAAAEQVALQAPDWLERVRVGTLMNYMGVHRGVV